MSSSTGGDLVAKSLVANHIDTVFGIPGLQLDPLFAGLHDVKEKIRIYHARHEQGVALMAFGYAHASGRVGTMMVVPGPGFLNATTGMLTAHACNTPMLCLVGQSEQKFIDSGLGVLHELSNQIGIAESLTKFTARAQNSDETTALVAQSLEKVFNGRTRPVYLELPFDVLAAEVQSDVPVIADQSQHCPDIDESKVEQIARELASAHLPLIMVGGGASHTGDRVQALAEMLGAPVGMSENGLGSVDIRHPQSFSLLGSNKLWGKADYVLGLGTRLFAPVYQWGWDKDMRISKVDIDGDELARLPIPVNGIQAETRQFLEKLLAILPEYLEDDANRINRHQALMQTTREEVAADLSDLSLPSQILGGIRQVIGDEGVLVCDVTQLNHACLELLPVHKPRTYISSGYQGTLGYGFCTAMGMKIAKPETPVVCLTGDGGFMYAAQELATAVQFDIPVVVVIINDGAYKNVEMMLNDNYQGRATATRLKNPDFLKFADSFGVQARRVDTPQALCEALESLLALNEPAVIDYTIDDLPSAFWLRFLPQVRKHRPE